MTATWREDLKRELWGEPPAVEPDAMFATKFFKDERGELHVRPGWSHAKWTAERMAGVPKTRSPEMQKVAL